MNYQELRKSSLAKDKKRLDWTTLQQSCLKGDVQANAWSGISWTVRKPNERCDRIKACVLVNGGYFEHQMKC